MLKVIIKLLKDLRKTVKDVSWEELTSHMILWSPKCAMHKIYIQNIYYSFEQCFLSVHHESISKWSDFMMIPANLLDFLWFQGIEKYTSTESLSIHLNSLLELTVINHANSTHASSDFHESNWTLRECTPMLVWWSIRSWEANHYISVISLLYV